MNILKNVWAVVAAQLLIVVAVFGQGLVVNPAFAAGCGFFQPTSYVANYRVTGRTTYIIRAQPNTNCDTGKRFKDGHSATVHAHSGNWRFIENHTTRAWGWVYKDAFRTTSTTSSNTGSSSGGSTSSGGCSWYQPKQYVKNYTVYAGRGNTIRPQPNSNCSTGKSVSTGHKLVVHAESGNWRFINNQSTSAWGWVDKNTLSARSGSTATTSGCSWYQPTQYVRNYTVTAKRSNAIRPQPNSSCSTGKSVSVGHRLTIHAESGVWRFIENHTTKAWGWVDVTTLISGTSSAPSTPTPPSTSGSKRINRTTFFNGVRRQFGSISSSQQSGIEFLLGRMEADTRPNRNSRSVWVREIAYIFATIRHEVANTYQPITEYSNTTCTRYDGGCRYKGRGYVQLTHKSNYQKMSSVVGIDLVAKPESALNRNVAWTVTSHGMFNGSFTGKRISNYISSGRTDFYNARRIVNGTDKARLIEGYAKTFQSILDASTN